MGLVNISINNQGEKENSMKIKQADAPKWAGSIERESNGNELYAAFKSRQTRNMSKGLV